MLLCGNDQLNRLALERQRKSQSEFKLLLDFISRTKLLQDHEVLISHELNGVSNF